MHPLQGEAPEGGFEDLRSARVSHSKEAEKGSVEEIKKGSYCQGLQNCI
jgi:hypothetical protein